MTTGEPRDPDANYSDPGFEEMVREIVARPEMWVLSASFPVTCAFLQGYDMARGGGPLLGFREWMIVRLKTGNNLHWIGLAGILIEDVVSRTDAGREAELARIRAFGALIEEYFRYRREVGVSKVSYDYEKWLLRQGWYSGPLRKKPGSQSGPGEGGQQEDISK